MSSTDQSKREEASHTRVPVWQSIYSYSMSYTSRVKTCLQQGNCPYLLFELTHAKRSVCIYIRCINFHCVKFRKPFFKIVMTAFILNSFFLFFFQKQTHAHMQNALKMGFVIMLATNCEFCWNVCSHC